MTGFHMVPGSFGPPFAGRRAILTGGSNGIGAAIAAELLGAGAELAILDLEPGQQHAERTVPVDLADRVASGKAFDRAFRSLGGCDVLVNCAGISLPGNLKDLDPAHYEHVLAVNLHAPIWLMKTASVPMTEAGYGRIVNVTSIHARLSEPGSLAYDVSKAGLEAATRTAGVELASDGVLVNAVAPGFVSTRMSFVEGRDELQSGWFKEFYVRRRRLPLARPGTPAEIARCVAWLASDLNTYMTGQVITADGGLSARF